MKKILAFCFFPAFVPPSNGGESRLFNLYRSLSKFHRVTLLTSTHPNSVEETICHGSNFTERRVPKDSYFFEKWEELTQYSSGGDLSAPCIAACGHHATPLHSAYLHEYEGANIIIHDFPFTIDYDLFFGVDDKIRVYNAHNCETTLYGSLHPDSKSQPIWDLVRACEVKILSGCDVVLYCNKDDLRQFEILAPDANYTPIAAPNGMSPLSPKTRPKGKKNIDSVVFIGSGHPPNIEAAQQIANNIAPDLPEVAFHIIGNCLPDNKHPNNVVKHGFVDDETKAELIQRADLAINPMGAGSGSNVKVFDFFSYGVPVLSSDFGMRGIDAEHELNCLIAPVCDFSKTIRLWGSRYSELQKIGLNGQEFAVRHHSWDVIARNVSEKLVLVQSSSRWTKNFILVLNDYESFSIEGGGGVRTRGICKAISEWRPVVFVSFSDDDELKARWENAQTLVISIPKTNDHKEQLQALNSSFHVAVDDIVAHRQCRANPLLVSIYEVLRRQCLGIVVEHPYMATLPISYRDRFVYSSQNNETNMKHALLQYHPSAASLINTVASLERRAIECSAALLAVSQEDAASFVKDVRTAGPVVVIPNGASDPAPPGPEEWEDALAIVGKRETAVFIGSSHMPNVDAVKFIVGSLAPSCPDVGFQIIGSVCDAFAANSAKNVYFWGRLSEKMKSAVMQSCSLAINPVIYGGGSNVKLADYFANGLPVITTPFGLRGYSDIVRKLVIVSELDEFAGAVHQALLNTAGENAEARRERQKLFSEHFSMVSKARSAVALLKSLECPKKKVLFVTYRYTDPPLGGAEMMLGKLIESLDDTNDYQIDVVSTEVSRLENSSRFAERYHFDSQIGARFGLKNVRFARFPTNDETDVGKELLAAWHAQPPFERAVYEKLKNLCTSSGLAWGWGNPERDHEGMTFRWGFVSCGLHLKEDSLVRVTCYSPQSIVIWLRNDRGELIHVRKANWHFNLEFQAPRGTVEIVASTALGNTTAEPRPLAFYISELFFDGVECDLAQPLVTDMAPLSDEARFIGLDEACTAVRTALDIRLTDIRGPFSSGLESYLESQIQHYDLVVTHNNVFRPAVLAVQAANKLSVPVISIPHAHLDDDFFHFPDVHQSIVSSDLVLAAPKAACNFYKEKGANVGYLPAGIDSKETFGVEDIAAFEKTCSVKNPFFLVLGRKSRAKGYVKVIDAVSSLNKDTPVHLVMIGPDDDNLPVSSRCVTYLGPQPREVVRGALMSCVALVNMSSSESFGIVLLEAWLAGKPVVVNDACAAFHDLAIDNHNALIVESVASLRAAIKRLLGDQELCGRLAENGKNSLGDYDWSNIGTIFVNSCRRLINERGTDAAEDQG